MGTRMKNLRVTDVSDGDTIKVGINGREEKLRLIAVDTEESWPGSGKPVTKAGKMAAEMAKGYFRASDCNFVEVDIEFDTSDPLEICLEKHRGNYGRIICYVHKGDENYNLKVIREGWSPYFLKYGRSRIYHELFARAEAEAQANDRGIWNPLTNAGGPSRDYTTLIPWWSLRAHIVDDYRRYGIDAGVLSVRVDYARLLKAGERGERVTIFCDLKDGIQRWTDNGALIYAGSPFHKFNIWIPDARTERMVSVINLIERRYAEHGRGYIYITGQAKMYRDIPEIVLKDISQLSDFPPDF